jgi:endoglycosylceramidase
VPVVAASPLPPPAGRIARRRLHPLLVAVLLTTALLAACSSSGSGSGSDASPDTTASSDTGSASGSTLRPLHAVRGADARVLDDQGRQVLLRGVNLNVLGDYGQANPDHPTVIPATDADWAEMQSDGFSVVRLLMS